MFVSKKLTFSEECLEMIKEFKKAGSFRSMSQTVEEIIRRVNTIKNIGTLDAVNIQLERIGISVVAEAKA